MSTKPEKKTKSEQHQKTRESILDATQQLMLRDGYAAVTSRKIAAEADLKSQLVHYYFRTMDELFLALYQRVAARHFESLVRVLTAKKPISSLWKLSTDRKEMGLIFEFMALANHREALREEIARTSRQTRAIQVGVLSKALEESGAVPDDWSADALCVLMAGAALKIVTDEATGATEGHSETIALIERLIQKLEP